MNKNDLYNLTHFAEMNGMMNWAFEDVLNEYLTTKEVAESYENPFRDLSDSALIDWYVMFLNGADYSDPNDQMDYYMFHEECKNRSVEFNKSITYLDSIL